MKMQGITLLRNEKLFVFCTHFQAAESLKESWVGWDCRGSAVFPGKNRREIPTVFLTCLSVGRPGNCRSKTGHEVKSNEKQQTTQSIVRNTDCDGVGMGSTLVESCLYRSIILSNSVHDLNTSLLALL